MSNRNDRGGEFVDTFQAAEELGVSRATIWNLIKRYQITRFRRPGEARTLIRRADLERLREPVPLDAPARRGRPRGTGTKKVAA